jgi:hypothetical protein
VREGARGRRLELRMLRMRGDLFAVVAVPGMLLGMFAGRNTRDVCNIILNTQCCDVFPRVNCVHFRCNDEFHCYDT